MADPANFLARWSRLKQVARTAPVPAEAQTTPVAAGEPNAATPLAELPPVESLTAESDFSVFMRPGVPEAARNAALQKLWRSDPVFANLDGLVEYGEDFAADFKSAAVVRTVYRVLQGMPDGREPAAENAQQTGSASEKPAEGAPSPVAATSGASAAATEPTAEPPAAASGRAEKDGLG